MLDNDIGIPKQKHYYNDQYKILLYLKWNKILKQKQLQKR